jgi:serine/threonine protein kinase
MPESFPHEPGSPRLSPGDIVAHYEIERFIARGGMAILYQARDTNLNRRVALKLIAPDLASDDNFRYRFIQESRLAASLDHPNIVPIFAAGEADDLLYLAMRYVEGMDLAQAFASYKGPVPPTVVVGILRQAAAALDAAHDAGLVHRDVKPANMLIASARSGDVDPNGHLYLTDFGLTKRTSSLSGFTVAGTFLGSIEYVAPEQIRAESVGPAADIYSLACVAYQGLTGTVPHSRPNNAAILWAHLSHDPTPPSQLCPGLGPSVDEAVAFGMAKDPDARPVTCSTFVRELATALEVGSGGRTRLVPSTTIPPTPIPNVPAPPQPGPDPGPRKPRNRLRIGLAALVAVIAAAAVVIALSLGGGSNESTFSPQPANNAPVSLKYPSGWTIYPHTSILVVIAAQPVKELFAGNDWSVTRSPNADPSKVVGVLLREVDGEAPAAIQTSAGADSLAGVLPVRPDVTAASSATVDGRRAGVFDGMITDPDGGTSLQLRAYQFAVNGNVTMNIVFFAPPSQFSSESKTFDKVLRSVVVSAG